MAGERLPRWTFCSNCIYNGAMFPHGTQIKDRLTADANQYGNTNGMSECAIMCEKLVHTLCKGYSISGGHQCKIYSTHEIYRPNHNTPFKIRNRDDLLAGTVEWK